MLPHGDFVMNRQPKESGQALLAAAFGLVVLLGAAGLAVDVGYLRYEKRLQQSAADSAALAGADELPSGNNALIATAATNDTALNGFTDGFTGPDGIYHVQVFVTPNFAFGGKTGVQVKVQVTQPTFFTKIFGFSSTTVLASAVAIRTTDKNCVYALNTFGTALNNNNIVNVAGCGIVDAANLHNGGTITAASVAVHGTTSGSPTTPPAVTGVAEAADPLSRLTAPGTGGTCKTAPPLGNDGNMVGTTGPALPKNFALTPGKYCSISISNKANVTFAPGTYVVTGAITFNGVGTVTGAGVTFYVSGGGGQVLINSTPGSGEQLTLHAPTNGLRAGILFYQDPGNTFPATIDGKVGSTLRGALYFPSATLNLSNINATAYTITVAKSLAFSGTVNLGSDYSSLPNGSPIKNAVLVE
jgi:Flp pilus assembly protein TadG